MDLITDLPPAEGFDSILVVVDQGLSKGVILIPCNKTITSKDTARLLLENLYKRFGLPDKIISDRGPQFASKAFVEFLKLLGVTSALSTAYHPQTDGLAERNIQTLENMIRRYCAFGLKYKDQHGYTHDWVSLLPAHQVCMGVSR